jgi:CelD/BcsL family acetyltransferase involved in cellulose biosynthesis
MLQISCIENEKAFQALEAEWNPLLQSSRSDSFFSCWEYVSTWWEIYGSSFQLLLLAAKNDRGQLVGVAPLMICRRKGIQGKLFRELGFIGQNVDTLPEYLDFFAAPECEAEVMAAFAKYLIGELGERWDSLRLETVRSESTAISSLERSLAEQGVALKRSADVPCYYASFAGGWHNYLKQKTRHFRSHINYSRNRLAKEGELRYLFAGKDIGVDEAFNEMVRLNRERWGNQGNSFRSENVLRLHRTLCHRITPKGWLVLVLLSVGENIVGAKYDYAYGGKIWGNQGGWSLNYQKKDLGGIFLAQLIEWGSSKQLVEYDFLGGEADYKERWSTGKRLMNDYEAFNKTFRGRALSCFRDGKEQFREHLPAEVLQRLRAFKRRQGL